MGWMSSLAGADAPHAGGANTSIFRKGVGSFSVAGLTGFAKTNLVSLSGFGVPDSAAMRSAHCTLMLATAQFETYCLRMNPKP